MKRARWMMVVVAVLTALAMMAPTVAGEKYKGFERGKSLITAQQLKALKDAKDPKLVVIGVVRKDAFLAGHIPDSYGVWRSAYTAAKAVTFPYGGMAMNREDFQKFARSLGIDNDSKVVIYDEKYDATRLWWEFYLYGKKDTMVLDGGYPAWKAAGYEVDRLGGLTIGKKEGNFVATRALPGWTASMGDVWRAKTDSGFQLWDTREPDEWNGTKQKKGAYTKGRIPWAKFLSWKDFRKKIDGKPTAFKTAAEIQKVLDKNGMSPKKDQIFYCQSGVRTTTHLFSLYLMGWDLSRLHNYDGSWIEWSYYAKGAGSDLNPVVVAK